MKEFHPSVSTFLEQTPMVHLNSNCVPTTSNPDWLQLQAGKKFYFRDKFSHIKQTEASSPKLKLGDTN